MSEAPAAPAAATTTDAGEDARKFFNYPLVMHSEMTEEMQTEATECAVSAVEKFAKNLEGAAKSIKDNMDKKFGGGWHVVAGEGFGFEVTNESKNILYMFVGGYLGILIWKCN